MDDRTRIVGTRQQLLKMTYETIHICSKEIKDRSCIRIQGVYLDPKMKMTIHGQHIEQLWFRTLESFVLCAGILR